MYEKEKAYRIIAHLKDFEGESWKLAFYDLWRYQMTYSMAYLIEVIESNRNGVYVHMVVKSAYAKSMVDSMESLGYRNISAEEEYFLIAESYDYDPDDYRPDECRTLLDVVLD